MKREKYDWKAIKTEFVTGEDSAAALAKKHGINRSTFYWHYKNERWNEARQEYKDSIADKGAGNVASIAAIKLAKEIDIADKLSDVLNEAIEDKKQFYRYIVKEKNGSDSTEEERIFGKMDMQSLNNAIKALSALQEIKCVMYGILPPIEERKLQLSQEKESENAETGQTGVVILPPVED